jgi:hypothetical protein
MVWIYFIILIIIIVFIIWIYYGGDKFEFIGLKNMDPPKVEETDTETSGVEDYNSGITSIQDLPKNSEDTIIIITESKSKKESKKRSRSKSKILYSKDILRSLNGDVNDVVVVENTVEDFIKSDFETKEISDIKKVPNYSTQYYESLEPLEFQKVNKKKKGSKMERKNASESRGESLCRQILERTYNKPFPTCRPDFLINPKTMYNLELDGYNQELGIAFEYNGIQHYVYPTKFHKTEEEFIDQVKRDQFKREACSKSGIYLITIPYEIPHAKIPQYIEYNLPENVKGRLEQEHAIDAPDPNEKFENLGLPEKNLNVGFSLI